MKKIFTKLMLLAVAAAALVSCENKFDEQTPVVELTQTVTLSAEKPTEVRTELIEGVPYWSKGDQIGVYVQDSEGYKNYAFKNDSEVASLTTSFTGTTAVANTLFVYYPYVAGSDVINGDGVVKANLTSNQSPTATSFDGAADIMIAKPVQLDEEGQQLENLEFARLGAIVKIVLKDKTGMLEGQSISQLTMTAATDLTGKVYLDVINQELGTLYANQAKSVSATYTSGLEINGENATYVVVYPQTLAAGSELTFAAETSSGDYTISRTLTIPAEVYPDGIVLESGKVTTLNVSLNDGDVKEVGGFDGVDNAYNLILATKHLKVGDKVVIAAANYDVALSTTQNSNNRGETAITKNANSTIEIDSTVEVLTVEAGNIEGTFAFKTSDNKYLYAASSSGNYLRSEATLSNNSSFLVNITEGVASVVAQGTNTNNMMRYNNNNKMFSCYASGQQDISIYKLVGEYVVKAPAITLSVANAVIAHDATGGEVAVTATNGDGWAINATTDATWVSALAYADGKITFTTTANEDEEKDREATVTVTATKADYENVTATFTITQGKKMAAGEVVSGEGTISFASTAQRTAYSTSSQTWSNEGITFVNDKSSSTSNVGNYSNPVRLYANSKITVTAPGNITKIVFDANNSSYATALNNSIGTPSGATVSVSSDKVTVTITNGSTEFVVASLSGQIRLDSITVTYGGSSEGGNTGGGEGGETPDPTPDPEEPGTGGGEPSTGTEVTTKYTFSDYSAGTQYAKNEVHKLDDVLTITTTDCHFTTQLRIYSSSQNNGYAIGALTGATIKSLGFNAGNKVDTLNVYGSTDGNTWTLVSGVSITSTSYKDYSVDFGNTNYTHFKLDVAGGNQVRIATLTLTYIK